jgi:HAD superfamily hydrolase (TIGR01509 family)
MIEAVIFDMDGLMFDTEILSFACWKTAAAKYGFEISEGLYLQTLGQTVEKDQEIYAEHFGEDFPFEAIKNERYKLGNEYFRTNTVPIKDGLLELLAYLKNHHYKTAVATSTSREIALSLIEKAGVMKFFDDIVCGDEVINSKPNPEIFLTAALKLGASPERCMVLEDSESGITAAYRAGMRPVLIPDLKDASEEVKQLAFRQLKSLKQVVQMFEENTNTIKAIKITDPNP